MDKYGTHLIEVSVCWPDNSGYRDWAVVCTKCADKGTYHGGLVLKREELSHEIVRTRLAYEGLMACDACGIVEQRSRR